MAGALLAALRAKGVTADELRGFAGACARWPNARRCRRLPDAVDIVGTGGDRSGSLNLSTGAALLAAACGLPVFKHGNRSISSRAGSADVLRRWGCRCRWMSRRPAAVLRRSGFTFLFAPYYHAATKSIAPVRAALGVRTVFNILGPLSNPAEPPYMVVGAFDAATAELLAQALRGTHIRRAFVIHGAEGWDEPTPVGRVHAVRCRRGRRAARAAPPASYGLPLWIARARGRRCRLQRARAAPGAVRRARSGARDPHRDALLLGAALALEVTGYEPTPQAAMARAAAAIDSGAARDAAGAAGTLRCRRDAARGGFVSAAPERSGFPGGHGAVEPRPRGARACAAQRPGNAGTGAQRSPNRRRCGCRRRAST